MIKKVSVIALAAVVLIGMSHAPAAAKSRKHNRNVPVYYLSLGTSLAAGVQADPATGESVVTDVSYPSELADILRQDIHKLRHVNLGCPGETAESFILGGKCDYPKGSQLDQAVQFLHAHSKFTGLITIDLGANDVLQCVEGDVIDPVCIAETLNQLSEDLVFILKTLQKAAPGVPIVGMNYYNPLLVYWFVDEALAKETVALQKTINSTLEMVYQLNGVPVADVAEIFMAYDLVTDANGNDLPDSLDLICLWTWMCSNQNIHANDEGYAVIAEQFYSVLPEIPISTPPRQRIRHGR